MPSQPVCHCSLLRCIHCSSLHVKYTAADLASAAPPDIISSYALIPAALRLPVRPPEPSTPQDPSRTNPNASADQTRNEPQTRLGARPEEPARSRRTDPNRPSSSPPKLLNPLTQRQYPPNQDIAQNPGTAQTQDTAQNQDRAHNRSPTSSELSAWDWAHDRARYEETRRTSIDDVPPPWANMSDEEFDESIYNPETR